MMMYRFCFLTFHGGLPVKCMLHTWPWCSATGGVMVIAVRNIEYAVTDTKV